jgi:hypothetical protein
MRLVFIVALAGISLICVSAAGAQSTATGVSRAFNPAISVNALLLGRVADESTDPAFNGAEVQEAELRFTADVDPFWKANLTFAVHPAHDHAHDQEAEHAGESHGGYEGDLEQAYVEGTAVPGGFGLLLGKDYLPFGKHVPLHTHQFPFVDAPVAVSTFLGDHSLSETGARLAHGIPLPWYVDLAAYAVDGKSEIFASESRDLAFGARLVNLFDLSRESTLELSGSWLQGPLNPGYLLLHVEEPLAGKLNVWGADATFKWISSSRSRGPALNLTGEIIVPRPDEGARDPFGWYAVAQYRFARNWWFGLGAGGMNRDLPAEEVEPEDEAEHHHGGLGAWEEVLEYKANLDWVPSEFSAVRLEVARYDDQQGDASDWLFSLQVNFTVGSHPAHTY